MTQTRSVRQSFTQSADADGRGSPYTARRMTGIGMLLVRGLPLRVGGRQMRHGRKGCGEPTKKSYEAPAEDNTSDRREMCVCIRPGLCLCLCVSVLRTLVACKSLVAKEFSQHRRRSFRLVIASLQIRPTAQTRAQRIQLDTTLRTPPAHTHTGCGRTDKDKLRGASRRQHKRERRGVSPARVGCLKFSCKRVFAALSS